LFDSHSPLRACPACGGTGIVEENETPTVCRECNGARLRPMALAVRVGRRNLPELTALTVTDALDCLGSICTETAPEGKGTGKRPGVDEREAPAGEGTRAVSVLRIDQSAILSRLMPPVLRRLEFLRDVGLGYLTLDRPLRTLSRGEAQRARLAPEAPSSTRFLPSSRRRQSSDGAPASRRVADTLEGCPMRHGRGAPAFP
jgi:excinuclease ABC subunit A